MKLGFFECSFCESRFVHETKFTKHRCDLMVRDEYVRTDVDGRFAFRVYKTWIEVRGYQRPRRSAFIESKYYNTIVKFVDFYREMMLPDLEDYMRFMVEDNLLPGMWSNAGIYEQYLIAFDDRVRPLKQADITFKYMDVLTESLDCTYAELFDYIDVREMVKLIQCRRFSPWVLLSSKRFMRYLAECNPNEAPALEAMVEDSMWQPRLRAWPKAYKAIRELTKELGI